MKTGGRRRVPQADGVEGEAWRRQIVAARVADLQLDGDGGSGTHGLGGIVEEAQVVARSIDSNLTKFLRTRFLRTTDCRPAPW